MQIFRVAVLGQWNFGNLFLSKPLFRSRVKYPSIRGHRARNNCARRSLNGKVPMGRWNLRRERGGICYFGDVSLLFWPVPWGSVYWSDRICPQYPDKWNFVQGFNKYSDFGTFVILTILSRRSISHDGCVSYRNESPGYPIWHESCSFLFNCFINSYN